MRYDDFKLYYSSSVFYEKFVSNKQNILNEVTVKRIYFFIIYQYVLSIFVYVERVEELFEMVFLIFFYVHAFVQNHNIRYYTVFIFHGIFHFCEILKYNFFIKMY